MANGEGQGKGSKGGRAEKRRKMVRKGSEKKGREKEGRDGQGRINLQFTEFTSPNLKWLTCPWYYHCFAL